MGVVAAYWLLLWRSGVAWTARRIVWTAVASAAAVTADLAAPAVLTALDDVYGSASRANAMAFTIGVIAMWLMATVFIWRETPAERAARVGASGSSAVACPTCGYNLTGLGEARCPECGSRFTLDELLAAQPARAAAGELG